MRAKTALMAGLLLLFGSVPVTVSADTEQEIIDVINRGMQAGAEAVITTEKDAVRIPRVARRDIPLFFLRVEIQLLSGEEDFNDCIARICFR